MAKQPLKFRKDDEDILTTSEIYFSSADEVRKPIVQRWDKYGRMFMNQFDFTGKSFWQSQSSLPKLSLAVTLTKAILNEPVRKNRDFFTVTAKRDMLKRYEMPAKELVNAHLDANNFRQGVFGDSLMSGLLCNLIIYKVFPRYVSKKNDKVAGVVAKHDTNLDIPKDKSDDQRIIENILREETTDTFTPSDNDRVCIDMGAIDPYNFRIDGSGRYRFVIEDIWKDLGEFKENAKEMGYDLNVIDRIEESYSGSDYKFRRRMQLQQGSGDREVILKDLLLQEYHGDLYDKDGNFVDSNMTWTVANGKYLIRRPVKNNAWHGKFPYVWGAAKRIPFSVYHKCYCDDIYALAQSLTDLFNLLIDSNAYAMAKAFELDLDMVYDPQQIATGVYPGKTFFKKFMGDPNRRMITDVSLGTINPQALRIYQEMDREFINASGLGTGGGTTSSKQRPTAREVDERSSISSIIMEDMANDIETGVVTPALNMILWDSMQYQTDFDDPRMSELSDQTRMELQRLSYYPKGELRKNLDYMKIKVEGISGLLRKQREFQKLTEMFALGAQAGEVGQSMLMRIRPEWAVGVMLDSMQIDKEKAFKSEEEMQKEREQAQMVEQAKQRAIQEQTKMKQVETSRKLTEQGEKNKMELDQNSKRFAQEIQQKQDRHLLDLTIKALSGGGKSG